MPATRVVIIGAALAAVAATGMWPAIPALARAYAPAAAGAASARATIPKPVAAGRLRIAGPLRDGSTVRAAGLTWRPGTLPSKDKLLSFAVSYTWQSCAATCARAADSTATPFAAARYIAGHADTGRRLRLGETASERGETEPGTLSLTQGSAAGTGD